MCFASNSSLQAKTANAVSFLISQPLRDLNEMRFHELPGLVIDFNVKGNFSSGYLEVMLTGDELKAWM